MSTLSDFEEDFLTQLYATKSPESMDMIYETIDYLLCEQLYNLVDSILTNININLLDSDKIIALLIITLAAKHELPSRSEFIKKAYDRLSELENEDHIDIILHGLY